MTQQLDSDFAVIPYNKLAFREFALPGTSLLVRLTVPHSTHPSTAYLPQNMDPVLPAFPRSLIGQNQVLMVMTDFEKTHKKHTEFQREPGGSVSPGKCSLALCSSCFSPISTSSPVFLYSYLHLPLLLSPFFLPTLSQTLSPFLIPYSLLSCSVLSPSPHSLLFLLHLYHFPFLPLLCNSLYK